MQPSPTAETSKLLFPSLRFCIVSPSSRSTRSCLGHASRHQATSRLRRPVCYRAPPAQRKSELFHCRVSARGDGIRPPSPKNPRRQDRTQLRRQILLPCPEYTSSASNLTDFWSISGLRVRPTA